MAEASIEWGIEPLRSPCRSIITARGRDRAGPSPPVPLGGRPSDPLYEVRSSSPA